MVGVLALQGAVVEHLRMLDRCGVASVEVRTTAQLQEVDSLILPGGESTTLGKLMERFGLLEAVRRRALEGMPLWGTCAGLILMATEIRGGVLAQQRLGLLDMEVERNAFGRQLDSFEETLQIAGMEFPAVFIRAPVIGRLAPGIEVLAEYQGQVVAARKARMLVTSFHPELSEDPRLHQYFLNFRSKQTGPAFERKVPSNH